MKPKKGDGKDQVIQMVLDTHKSQCSIIYCHERGTTLDIAYLLQKRGVNAIYYHSALDPFKKKNFQACLDGKALVMCATITFGMGETGCSLCYSSQYFAVHGLLRSRNWPCRKGW